MDSLETEAIDVISIVEKIGIPSGSKGINSTDILMFADFRGYNPIFASLKNNYDRPKAFGVDVERADGPLSPNQRPFHFRLYIRHIEPLFIIGRDTGLCDFVRC
jgi:hypothetical protein